jgi:hypothetical protein
MYYLQIFRGWGLLVLCVVADGFVTVKLSLLAGVNASKQLGYALAVWLQ